MAYADFKGKPTYFAVFMMMISIKNANQNMLKIPFFLKKFVKIRQAMEVPPSDLSWQPPPHAILLTPTVVYCYKTF